MAKAKNIFLMEKHTKYILCKEIFFPCNEIVISVFTRMLLSLYQSMGCFGKYGIVATFFAYGRL